MGWIIQLAPCYELSIHVCYAPRFLGLITLVGLQGCERAQAIPDGFVDVGGAVSGIPVEARYYGKSNFVGAPVDGYAAPKCYLTRAAAQALARVQKTALAQGYALKIFDCYRPQRAVNHFVRWVQDLQDVRTKAEYYPRVEKQHLFRDGYIAERSGHSRGSTLDLTLVRDGAELDIGTPYDFFDPRSHTINDRITPRQQQNRLLLKSLMEQAGFVNLQEEWWHYSLEGEPHPQQYFDFVVQ